MLRDEHDMSASIAAVAAALAAAVAAAAAAAAAAIDAAADMGVPVGDAVDDDVLAAAPAPDDERGRADAAMAAADVAAETGTRTPFEITALGDLAGTTGMCAVGAVFWRFAGGWRRGVERGEALRLPLSVTVTTSISSSSSSSSSASASKENVDLMGDCAGVGGTALFFIVVDDIEMADGATTAGASAEILLSSPTKYVGKNFEGSTKSHAAAMSSSLKSNAPMPSGVARGVSNESMSSSLASCMPFHMASRASLLTALRAESTGVPSSFVMSTSTSTSTSAKSESKDTDAACACAGDGQLESGGVSTSNLLILDSHDAVSLRGEGDPGADISVDRPSTR
eukprot:Opistho-2@19622